jgi:transcriptional regulator of acetoin/glycerol metabolism
MVQRPSVHPLTITAAVDVDARARERVEPVPGLVVIFANRRPADRLFSVKEGPVTLGRLELADGAVLDSSISREHARFAFDGGAWQVIDLGSRNSTFVNGHLIANETSAPSGALVRIGGALVLTAADIVPFTQYGLGIKDGVVGGPSLRRALESVAFARAVGMVTSMLITGETGSGKEIAAKAFHVFGLKPGAPCIAVNCATIPKELAERLLFGSRRGAFSGATDAQGYVQAADGGTLFLDEIAELPTEVQGKLLRMLETREVLRLGATSHEQVDVRVCAATWRDLRVEVGAGRFRQDLYFRIAQAEVRVPPLRKRVEEVPWHIQHVLVECGRDQPLSATAPFVEACAHRTWPGNVRELRAEVRRAATAAVSAGSNVLSADDLGTGAGRPIPRVEAPASSRRFPDDEVAAALAAEGGNVVSAARRLGVHRNKVRRWLERHELDAKRFKATRGRGHA